MKSTVIAIMKNVYGVDCRPLKRYLPSGINMTTNIRWISSRRVMKKASNHGIV